MRYGFLDWSGDLGFNFDNPGVSRYIAFMLVATDNRGTIRRAMLDFREKHGLTRTYEFHYTQEPHKLRRAFFTRLNGEDMAASFIAAGLMINKRQLPVNFHRMREPDFLAHFVAECAQQCAEELKGMMLLIDGQPGQDDPVRRAVRIELSRRGHRLSRIKMRPSGQEDGIQLADMLVGALVDAVEAEFEPELHGRRHDHFQRLWGWQIEKREVYKATEKTEGRSASPSALYLKLTPYGYPGD